ncbi:hypothetical protein APSETT444_007235 [Aspergillus pseudonomiae]
MAAKLTITDLVPLPNSAVRIPRLGFGVYRSPPTQCVLSTSKALEAGYRHVDTAQFYANEKEVGDAIRASGIPRSDIFVTTKILVPGGSPDATYSKLLASVEKIGGPDGYVDLFLIHSANSGALGRKEMWQALERLLEEGKTKSIGVSNWGVKHIEEMKSYAKRVVDAYCKKHGIVVEAYSPIVRNYKASDPTLVELAKKYGKTTQQVLVRYALQKAWVPLPKSDNPDRIVANANVFDFEISEEDMAVLNALDQGSAGAIVEAVENE